MAAKAVVDASIIVKWFIEEEYTKQALKLRDELANGNLLLIAPSLLNFEVLNALRYCGLFNKKELKELAVAIGKYGFELHNLIGNYAELTANIANTRKLSIYDASYTALAELYDIDLYSVDNKIIEKCKLAVHLKDV
ncbi:MAG: type II toxin-antitoxin system VapC family toxin [Thermoplasmata archaeon]|nr:MAG: type II toxin-antitoxin system VapC family toxin [Thermoplasmata archaeon]